MKHIKMIKGSTFIIFTKKDLMETREILSEQIAIYKYSHVENPLAVVLLVHGLGEHAGRYEEWAGRFAATGVAFRAFDLPGHGRSGGRRGTMPPLSKLYSIIEDVINETKHDFSGVPLFLYGHSLGGGLVLNFIVKRKPEISGAIITSPWVKLTETPPKIKLMIASLARKILPDMTQHSGLKTMYLSHDPEVVKVYENDPLVHGMISAGLFASITEAAEETLKNASAITTPMLLIHGRDDMIASPAGTIEVAGAAPNALLKLWDGAYHEVHNDLLKEEHFEFIREWIDTLLK